MKTARIRPLVSLILIAVASAAVFMDYLDSSIVAVVLPELSAEFGVSSSASSWVLISYLLSIGCTLVLFGKIADRHARYKLIFVSGFVLFAVSSLFCGVAPALPFLIVFRFIQGVSAAMMVSTATPLLHLHLPERLRAPSAGVLAACGGIALAAGPGIGGLLAGMISWHWVFYLNVPVGIAAVILALVFIPKDSPAEKLRSRFDGTGTALFAASVLFLFSGLEFGAQESWPVYSIVFLVFAPVFGILFVRHELRCNDPLLSPELFRSRQVMFAAVSTMLSTAAFFGLLYVLPFYFAGLGIPVYIYGLLILIPPACIAAAGIPSGILAAKFGCRSVCTAGTFIQAAGIAGMVCGMIISSMPVILCGMVVTGIGSGLNEGPSIRRISAHSPAYLQGSAGGLIFTAMNAGCVLGIAVFSVAASAASGSADFTEFGMAVSCIAGVITAVFAGIISVSAKDTVKA